VSEQRGEEELDPAAAFEALRAEVVRTRRAVETLAGTSAPGALRPDAAGAGPPDYTETLGAMNQVLKGVSYRLEKIEASQALKMTPESYARDLAAQGVRLNTELRDQLNASRRALETATGKLEQAVGQAWARRRQQLWLLAAGGGGAVLGVVLWILWSGPTARLLPPAWAVPERMAAATLDTDRATAGQRLLQSVNPQEWMEWVAALRLYRANHEAVERCRAAVAASGKAKTCSVRIEPTP
jgi:hypothetical protein